MGQGIEFKGLMHYPKGNSSIEKIGEGLKVSNIEECSDGVIIKTPNIDDYKGVVEGIEINEEETLTITYFGKDGHGRIKATEQLALYYDADKNERQLAVNSKMLADTFIVRGLREGEQVFEKEYNKDELNGNWIWVIVIGIIVIDNVTYKRIKERNDEGELVVTEEQTDWGTSSIADVKPRGDDTWYEVDHIIVEHKKIFDSPLPSIDIVEPESIELCLCNISNFIIKDHIY